MAFRTGRRNKQDFLDCMFGHKTNTSIGGHTTGKMNNNTDILEKIKEDLMSDSDNEEEFIVENYKPILNEYLEDEIIEYDELTGEEKKKKKKKRKMKKIVGLPIIKPIISSAEAYGEAPHENLLRPPFSLLVIAPKGSGKTTVSINVESYYDGEFDSRIMFSPTFKIDDNWKAALDNGTIKPYKKENFSNRYNEAKLNKMWKCIKKENKSKKNYNDKSKVYFLFDDIIGELPRNRANSMYKIARNHRHYGVSNTIISQEYTGLAPVIRKNATGIILFGTTDGGEIKTITDAQGGFIGKNRFFRMWAYCISKEYGFLFINKDYKNKHRYFCKFNEELNPMDFSNEKVRDMIDELQTIIDNNPTYEKEDKEDKEDIDTEYTEDTEYNHKNCEGCVLEKKKDLKDFCYKCLIKVGEKLRMDTDDLDKEELLKKINKIRLPIIKKMIK